jgi:hypothetical protein
MKLEKDGDRLYQNMQEIKSMKIGGSYLKYK